MWIMRLSISLCALALVCPGLPAQSTQAVEAPPSLPKEAGVYYQPAGAGWIRLKRALPADSKTRGIGRFMDTNGLSGLNVTLTYRGARAPLQLRESRPVFYAQGTGTAKATLLVQLTRKKDSRETKISSTDAGFDNQVGFKLGEIRRVVTSPINKNIFSIKPDEELKPGEYLLVLGDAEVIFDFGVIGAEK